MATVDNRVEVALPSDENYVCGLLVTAASMAKYMPSDVTLSINVLDGGIHDDTFASFMDKVRGIHERTEFRRLHIDESVFADYPKWSGNRMTYARLMLAELLPDVDHVIYCDTDYLWLTDVSELWKLRDDAVILQSSRDGAPETELRERVWCEKNGLAFDPERYFCAGLSFYNLRLFRQEQIIRQVSDFLVAHPNVPFADQTAMNVLIGQRTRLLPQKWQRFSRDLTDEELKLGCAIHFAGETPWRKLGLWITTITDSMLVWHRFNAHIHHISTWQSLRCWYGTCEIIRRRLVFHLALIPIFRNLFFYLLRHTGRGAYIADLKVWCRPLKWNGVT